MGFSIPLQWSQGATGNHIHLDRELRRLHGTMRLRRQSSRISRVGRCEFLSEVMSWNIPVEVGALCQKKHGLRGFFGGKQKNVDKKTGGAEGQIDKLVENFKTFFAEKKTSKTNINSADVP